MHLPQVPTAFSLLKARLLNTKIGARFSTFPLLSLRASFMKSLIHKAKTATRLQCIFCNVCLCPNWAFCLQHYPLQPFFLSCVHSVRRIQKHGVGSSGGVTHSLPQNKCITMLTYTMRCSFPLSPSTPTCPLLLHYLAHRMFCHWPSFKYFEYIKNQLTRFVAFIILDHSIPPPLRLFSPSPLPPLRPFHPLLHFSSLIRHEAHHHPRLNRRTPRRHLPGNRPEWTSCDTKAAVVSNPTFKMVGEWACIGEKVCGTLTGNFTKPIVQPSTLTVAVKWMSSTTSGFQTDFCALMAENGQNCPIPAGPKTLHACIDYKGVATEVSLWFIVPGCLSMLSHTPCILYFTLVTSRVPT